MLSEKSEQHFPVTVKTRPKYIKTRPEHIKTRPKYIKTRPKYIKTRPEHIRLQKRAYSEGIFAKPQDSLISLILRAILSRH